MGFSLKKVFRNIGRGVKKALGGSRPRGGAKIENMDKVTAYTKDGLPNIMGAGNRIKMSEAQKKANIEKYDKGVTVKDEYTAFAKKKKEDEEEANKKARPLTGAFKKGGPVSKKPMAAKKPATKKTVSKGRGMGAATRGGGACAPRKMAKGGMC